MVSRFSVSTPPAASSWHGLPHNAVLTKLDSTPAGLSDADAQTRLQYAKGEVPPADLFKDLYDGVWPALLVGTPAGPLESRAIPSAGSLLVACW